MISAHELANSAPFSTSVQGTGDENSRFRVHRYRSRGYFVLEALAQGGGHFLGMKESGAIDEFVASQECCHLYPRVIEC